MAGKRRRKPKRSRSQIHKVRHGDKLKVPASIINVHFVRGQGGRVWLEVVPPDADGPQDDAKECDRSGPFG